MLGTPSNQTQITFIGFPRKFILSPMQHCNEEGFSVLFCPKFFFFVFLFCFVLFSFLCCLLQKPNPGITFLPPFLQIASQVSAIQQPGELEMACLIGWNVCTWHPGTLCFWGWQPQVRIAKQGDTKQRLLQRVSRHGSTQWQWHRWQQHSGKWLNPF